MGDGSFSARVTTCSPGMLTAALARPAPNVREATTRPMPGRMVVVMCMQSRLRARQEGKQVFEGQWRLSQLLVPTYHMVGTLAAVYLRR